MINIKNILILPFLFTFFTGLSQPFFQPNFLQQITASAFVPYYLQYDKDPYFYNKWATGSVTLISGEKHDSLKLKYDIHKDELHYYNDQLKKILHVDKEIVKEFTFNLNDEVYVVGKSDLFEDYNEGGGSFYFVLVDGEISLWCKRYKEINEYTEFSSAYSKLGAFYLKQKYYIVKSEGKIRISLNKRLIAKQFPEKRKEILAFIRENKLNVKNEKHLIKIFTEINALSISRNSIRNN